MGIEKVGKVLVIYDQSESGLVCPAISLQEQHHKFAQPVVNTGWFARSVRNITKYYLPNKDKEIPDTPCCVVVATGGNLGGTILSLPLMKAVRERFSTSHIAVVCNTKIGKELMEFVRIGDSFHVIQPGIFQSPDKIMKYIATLVQINKRKPEVLIANYDNYIDHFLIPIRIPIRIGNSGVSISGHSLFWDTTLNFPVPIKRGLNWLEPYRMIGKKIKAEISGPPSIRVHENLQDWAKDKLIQLGLKKGEKCIAVQIGVWERQAWKQWPLEKLSKACLSLWKKFNLRPVLLGDVSGLLSLQKFRSLSPDLPFISMVGTTTVAQAAAIISMCKASICNDSGLMHLSAAVGTPTIAVYGMTDPEITWCYERPHRIVRRQDCLPCYSLDIRVLQSCLHRKCLTQLEEDVVVRAVGDAVSLTNDT